uniref:Fe-S cluster assembly protein SufB n=1 Tax=Chromera velia CCMP2878 TaxID=1169474 RepID=A0A0G4GC98_9ALVE|mmetsp:Transcript_52284/g.102356  ORF Transcript_52284/g.102356 Transcript_52284/m.102356 type:complete len:567 (-) Transcript_52284:885-2585(-)|eukprot:Cvel_4495.t1-p1 / transcript=Cvel_4495.t1 / gene=Cvel_4495 / organism=Chromera_velia_CCMP2878 / gene_product=UPF0051 protein ycf24, putative / transcript_product=UPF0051 protein ycf24, putative / location=Cvel_scaffold197:1368-6223(-) / protein_length=566 / sequence_SO=supercontig / SO=protein_coding / is_pseudo=false
MLFLGLASGFALLTGSEAFRLVPSRSSEGGREGRLFKRGVSRAGDRDRHDDVPSRLFEAPPSSTSTLEIEPRAIPKEVSVEDKFFSAANRAYQYGFTSKIESTSLPPGLDEEKLRQLSAIKEEPQWMLDWRLKAYMRWKKMKEPQWAHVYYPPVNYDTMSYYSAPKNLPKHASLDEVDPDLLATFEKLGIPLNEQKRLANVAVDAVFDSVSIATTFKEELSKEGIIFCSISEAIDKYPDLIRKYMGSVVPQEDNYFTALNSAVFSDGTFVYVPPDTQCPMDLSTYFRINDQESGQFERTLIVADRNSSVSYLEGCTAPAFSSHQLHAAVVELVALDDAKIKYSTVQNWYAGDEKGKGGIYNFVTKRGRALGKNSKISWTQVEAGSAITWKYPSCVLEGEGSTGEFYSVALTNGRMQADTGTKMVHVGPKTKSRIISKGISADESVNTYRGLVQVGPRAVGAKSYTRCDSMLIGSNSKANTFPVVQSTDPKDPDGLDAGAVSLEHEATTSKVKEDVIFYLQQRGLSENEVVSLITTGFVGDVLNNLPMEFAMEADQLLSVKLSNPVG